MTTTKGTAIELIGERYLLPKDHISRRGGMARVVSAIDTNNGEKVALKLFSGSQLDVSEVNRVAYENELSALSNLKHSNIVRILNFGRCLSSNQHFVALTWLDHDLDTEIKKFPVRSWDDFWDRLGRPILDALVLAHTEQIAHRDLKPKNIMFSEGSSVPYLTDFGIAKFMEKLPIGDATMNAFRSVPFCPPSDEPSHRAMSRDVYSFGALAIRCLTNKEIQDYDDLYSTLDDLNLDQQVNDVIVDCVAKNVDDRIQTALDLQHRIASLSSESDADPEKPEAVPITFISNGVTSAIRAKYAVNESDARRILIDLLNSQAHISYENSDASDSRIHIVLDEFSIFAKLDNSASEGIALVTAIPVSPEYVSRFQESSLRSAVNFRIADRLRPSAGDDKSIRRMLAQIESVRALLSPHREDKEPKIFKVWRSVLQAKDELARSRHPDIHFSKAQRSGFFVDMTAHRDIPEDLIESVYDVRTFRDERISVRISEISGRNIRAEIDGSVDLDFPDDGTLHYDLRRHDASIRKQQEALQSVIEEKIANSELSRIIRDPSIATNYGECENIHPFVKKLDRAKVEAARNILSKPPLYLVIGPPGTGKTELIAELIMQTITRNPASRVLLTAQTHNAVDNAILRLKEVGDVSRLVRIGNANQEKISSGVSEMLLKNAADRWITGVRVKSMNAVAALAKQCNEDVDLLRLVMAEKAIRSTRTEIKSLEQRASKVRDIIRNLEEQRRDKSTSVGATQSAELDAEGESHRDELGDILKELRVRSLDLAEAETLSASFGIQSQEMGQLSEEEFESWWEVTEAAYSGVKLKEIVQVVDEWLSRLRYSSEILPAVLLDSNVIAGTCLGFSMTKGAMDIEYDLAIIDEASKVSSTEILVPMSRAKRVVLVGDSKQLPPFIEYELLKDETLADRGLTALDVRSTLFDEMERLLPPANQTTLDCQYRMDKPIADLISHCFYNDSLRTSKKKAASSVDFGLGKPIRWFDTGPRGDRFEDGVAGFWNSCEVEEIYKSLRSVKRMLEERKHELSVVLLTPYGRQKAELLKMVRQHREQLSGLTIDVETVHAYQGREADICMLSLVRCNPHGDIGFLKSEALVNVAMSRAKSQLRIYGDFTFYERAREGNHFKSIAGFIRRDSNCGVTKCS